MKKLILITIIFFCAVAVNARQNIRFGTPLEELVESVYKDNRKFRNALDDSIGSLSKRLNLEALHDFAYDCTLDSAAAGHSSGCAEILRFLEDCCGIYLYEGTFKEGGGYGISTDHKHSDMPSDIIRLYQKWVRENLSCISPALIDIYVRWRVIDKSLDDVYFNHNKDRIYDLLLMQKHSFPVMFQWYVQGGQKDLLPPQGIIDAGFHL